MTQAELLIRLLTRLRRIGWSAWDPIGLIDVREQAEDEYDHYLLRVASSLAEGRSPDELTSYLVRIECEHVGLGERQDTRVRAAATVAAVAQLLGEGAMTS